jgi:hypothetical protein
MALLNFFNLPNLCSRTLSLGFTQLLPEVSTRNKQMFLGFRARPVRKADNRTAICEPIVYTMWDTQQLTIL